MALITSTITYYRSIYFTIDVTVTPPSPLTASTALFTVKADPYDDSATDNMQMSRSTEFQLPATPHNNLILGFALDPSSDGGWVRQKKQAELHYSGGKIDGFLFFGKYGKGNYSAIFVYGELEALRTAREKGNLVEYCDFPESLPTVSPTFRSAYSLAGALQYSFAW